MDRLFDAIRTGLDYIEMGSSPAGITLQQKTSSMNEKMAWMHGNIATLLA